MTSLDAELAVIGDRLQIAWRSDARRARRHHRTLLAGAFAALLALTGAAIASDAFPVDLSPTRAKAPAPAALTRFQSTYKPLDMPLQSWQKALKLHLDKAVVIARMTSRETGPLSIIIIPAGRRGACLDAARPDGTSYLGGCTTAPDPTLARHSVISYHLNVGVMAFTKNGVHHGPIDMSIRTAPTGAARIDVRARDASRLPALISHGWLFFVDTRTDGAAVLVRVYDKSGRRLLSYYG
jgi:hypothetical protein